MAQKLILPINQCKLTASMKTAAYKARFGYVHYGVDMVSRAGSYLVYASGEGTVVGAGWDNVVGNVIAVKYPAALNRATGKYGDVVFRYYHLSSISVKKGQAVTKDTVLGYYGSTGMLQMAAHLHIEADTDVDYPMYSPTVRSSNLIKGTASGAHDKTMGNPLLWLHRKVDAPDNQTYTTAGDVYILDSDKSLPAFS